MPASRLFWIAIAVAMLLGWPGRRAAADEAPAAGQPNVANSAARLAYNSDIRPILSNNCFKCHGPDARERKAELRSTSRPKRENRPPPAQPQSCPASRTTANSWREFLRLTNRS